MDLGALDEGRDARAVAAVSGRELKTEHLALVGRQERLTNKNPRLMTTPSEAFSFFPIGRHMMIFHGRMDKMISVTPENAVRTGLVTWRDEGRII